MGRELRIVARVDGTVTKRIDISPATTERQVEKLMSGLLRNMNTDLYRLEDSADDPPKPARSGDAPRGSRDMRNDYDLLGISPPKKEWDE